MDFLKIIRKRRSIRRFDKQKKIKLSDFKNIIEAGLYAPSTKNINPWNILVLNSIQKEQLGKKLIKLIDNNPSLNEIKYIINIIQSSARFILIFNNGEKSGGIKSVLNNTSFLHNYLSEILSIGACIENMLLEATSLGIDSLIIRDIVLVENYIKEFLGINIDSDLIGGVVFGYRASKNYGLPKADIKFTINKDGYIKSEKNIIYPQ